MFEDYYPLAIMVVFSWYSDFLHCSVLTLVYRQIIDGSRVICSSVFVHQRSSPESTQIQVTSSLL